MYSLFFFVVGLANLVLAVVLFTQGETVAGIGIMLIGISCTVSNGTDILQRMREKNNVD